MIIRKKGTECESERKYSWNVIVINEGVKSAYNATDRDYDMVPLSLQMIADEERREKKRT